MTYAYIQMGLALMAVIGLMLLLAFFLKKRQLGKSSMMNIMAYQSLGPKKGIAAIQVGHEVLLVGVTANDIKLLKSLDGALPEPGGERDAVRDIAEKLKSLRNMKETAKSKLYANS